MSHSPTPEAPNFIKQIIEVMTENAKLWIKLLPCLTDKKAGAKARELCNALKNKSALTRFVDKRYSGWVKEHKFSP